MRRPPLFAAVPSLRKSRARKSRCARRSPLADLAWFARRRSKRRRTTSPSLSAPSAHMSAAPLTTPSPNVQRSLPTSRSAGTRRDAFLADRPHAPEPPGPAAASDLAASDLATRALGTLLGSLDLTTTEGRRCAARLWNATGRSGPRGAAALMALDAGESPLAHERAHAPGPADADVPRHRADVASRAVQRTTTTPPLLAAHQSSPPRPVSSTRSHPTPPRARLAAPPARASPCFIACE